jgi:hypothetical protein
MAVRKATRRITRKKRRRLKGGNFSDFAAGFTAPFKAIYHVIRGQPDKAEQDFTSLGPRLSKGFNGKGRRRLLKHK